MAEARTTPTAATAAEGDLLVATKLHRPRPRPEPVAWLSLDERDNDPARFWRHVAAALARVRPGVGERVAALLGGPQPA
jgi:ATP/maltotriose-dependent transcriptional regulator MalT